MPKHATHAEAGQDHNRADAITPGGKAINQPLTHAQRMRDVSTSAGHQGSSLSGDYRANKRDEDRGGYGMTDTDRLTGNQAGPGNAHARYIQDQGSHSVGNQPGREHAYVPEAKGDAAKPGHETPEGRARDDGLGHDERGRYGRGARDAETPEPYAKTPAKP